MSNIDELVPSQSKYLTKNDVGEQGMNLRITGFERQSIKGDNGDEEKAVIVFAGNVKPMVLNKTNAARLKHIFGSGNTDNMVGKTVNVFNDPMIEFGGRIVGGLRIRAPQGQATAQPRSHTEGPRQPTPPAEAYDSDIPFDDDPNF